MVYGAKRGVKAPGEFGWTDYIGLAMSGATGIVAALVTDYQQKQEASAIYVINQWVVGIAGLLGVTQIPLYWVVLGIVAVGAGSIFYFQPITRQGAFAQGFGLLAVLMTAVPADLAGGLQSTSDELDELEPLAAVRDVDATARISNANFSLPEEATVASAEIVQVNDTSVKRDAAKYQLRLSVNFPDGLPNDLARMIRNGTLRGRLHNEDTKQTFNLFRTAGGEVKRVGNRLEITAGVPARSQTAQLWVRIEANGYAIEQTSASATLGRPLSWRIDMKKSSTPLFVQRLGQSYWF
ncbi:MAG: hypothetical protein AAF850_05630 [Pseudomonadota bacterium]